MNYIEYVRLIFDEPRMSERMTDAIIWGCTGYPEFWGEESWICCLTKQLRHAKRSLARGFTIDQIFEGIDKCKRQKGRDTVLKEKASEPGDKDARLS